MVMRLIAYISIELVSRLFFRDIDERVRSTRVGFCCHWHAADCCMSRRSKSGLLLHVSKVRNRSISTWHVLFTCVSFEGLWWRLYCLETSRSRVCEKTTYPCAASWPPTTCWVSKPRVCGTPLTGWGRTLRGRGQRQEGVPRNSVPWERWESGSRLNIKTAFPRYGDSHVKDKTVVRPSYL